MTASTFAITGTVAPLSVAFAQSANPPASQTQAAPGTLSEEIVVTGTRVVRDGYEAPTPVSVIGVETLQNIATSNLADSINQLPVLSGSSTPTTTAVTTTSGTAAINGLNLRGLGTSRTLVLLNGQRTVGSILTGVVDVSELPQHLIERVDVVTGGASAAYGSDALTGVVNFVLDDDFTGIKGEISAGITDYGDAPNYKVNGAYGTAFAGGRGHFLLSGEHSWDDGLLFADRPWAREGHGYINNPAYTATNGQPRVLQSTQIALGPVASWGGTIAQGPLRGLTFGPGGTYYQLPLGDIVQDPLMRGGGWESQQVENIRGAAVQPRQNRQDVFTRVSYDISDDLQVYAHAAWGHLGSYSSAAPHFFPGNLTLNVDNAFLPDALRPTLAAAGTTFTFGTMNWDLDNFRPVYDRRVLRFLVGAEGVFDAAGKTWNWDAYVGNGEAFGTTKAFHAIDQRRYALAIDAVRAPNGAIVCRSTLTNPGNGCVPYNAFGMGVNSQAAIDYIQGRHGWNLQRLNQRVIAFNVNGEPFETWAGPVSTAVGYEYRKESMRQLTDPEEQADPTIWFQGAGQPYTGKFVVNDFYAETVIPLAKDEAWATALDLNASVRATHYSTYGWVATWKVGATYSPFDDLRFRATRSRNIRSPTLVDLYSAGTNQNNSVADPFNNNLAVRYTSRNSGNSALVAEKSDDVGLGVVYRPSWFEGFVTSFDYYRINVKDAVNTPGAGDLLTLCYQGNQSACGAITRTGTGTSTFLFIQIQPQNFANEKARGFDIEASYSLPLSVVADSLDGTFNARVLATHYLKYVIDNGSVGSIPIDYAGVNGGGNGVPSWRIQGTLGYNLNPINVGLTARYISSGLVSATAIECTTGCPTSTAQNLTVSNNTVDSAIFFDVNLGYKVDVGEASQADLFLNVRNLTNRDPAIVPRGPGGTSYAMHPTNSGLYDMMGRVYRAGIRFKM